MNYRKIREFARQMRKAPTPAEHCFWEKVRKRRFLDKKFTRQFIIQHQEIQGQKKFFIADFHCHEKKLIVEIDGGIHLQQREYDQIRENILREMGFQIVRFKNEEVLKDWKYVEQILIEVLG